MVVMVGHAYFKRIAKWLEWTVPIYLERKMHILFIIRAGIACLMT